MYGSKSEIKKVSFILAAAGQGKRMNLSSGKNQARYNSKFQDEGRGA